MLRLTRAQVREIDRLSIEQYHIPGIVLMENAARSAAMVAMEMSAQHRSALIFCGGGNNGGDGLAIARHLHNAGWSIQVIRILNKPYTGDALINDQILTAMGVHYFHPSDAPRLMQNNPNALIIDAIFGTGLQAPPRETERSMIDLINQSGRPILAIDLPSGLDCDTGEPLSASCIRATKTITFVAGKVGFANPVAKLYTGQILIGDIGCPKALIATVANGF